MDDSRPATPDLQTLVELFFASTDRLGSFVEVTAADVPEPYQSLLAHDAHMTVTVESHHGCPVSVEVLGTQVTPFHYARQILLRRTTDGGIVQFGIVRLDFAYLGKDVRREIESQQIPLGRILIDHNVLRRVQLTSLWRIEPSDELRRLVGRPDARDRELYGRTALIFCNGEPAVELLEIVTPN